MSDDVTAVPCAPAAKKRLWWRVVLRLLFLFVMVPYVAIGGLMIFMQRQLLFVPTKTERLHASQYSTADLPIDDVDIVAENGLILHGWRFAPQNPPSDPPRLVLYFPGNAGCRRDRLQDCRDFTELGCAVLLMDYRGYGDNDGAPSESAFARDASHLWHYATTELKYEPDQIVIFGESLGGAVSIRLTSELSNAPVPTPPAALVLNSTFASMGDTVEWHYPAFPFRYFLLYPFPSIQRIPRVKCPVLQFHGTADETVPYSHGERLFTRVPESANGIAKQFVTIPDAGHNMISAADMSEAMRTLLDKLDQP